MSWKSLQNYPVAVEQIRRGLDRGRLAHAYLVSGPRLEVLEQFALTLAKTINCHQPREMGQSGWPLESCDTCLSCRKVDQANHPDVFWIRAESKSRQIRGEQMGEVLQSIYLKPNEARYKVHVIVAADRLNSTAANKFLKTLEEPPADSVMILLSVAPEQVLETLRSRCQKIVLFSNDVESPNPAEVEWLQNFGVAAAADSGGLLERYRLLSLLLKQLSEMKDSIEKKLSSESMLETAQDLEPSLREKLENELSAAVEAEYRRQRSEIVQSLQWWLRDIWLQTLQIESKLWTYPQFQESTAQIGSRLQPGEALRNLEEIESTHRLLNTNVQEALALEVGLLKLKF